MVIVMIEKAKKKRRRLVRDRAQMTTRYKLYKSGTKWVVAGMTTVVFSFSLATYVTPTRVKADENAVSTTSTSETTSSTSGQRVLTGGTTADITASSDTPASPTPAGNVTTATDSSPTSAADSVTTAITSETDATAEKQGDETTTSVNQTENSVSNPTESTSPDIASDSDSESVSEAPSVDNLSNGDVNKPAVAKTAMLQAPIDNNIPTQVTESVANATHLSDVTSTAIDVTGKLPHANINRDYLLDGNDYMTVINGYNNTSGIPASTYAISSTGVAVRIPYVNGTWAYDQATPIKSAITRAAILATLGNNMYSNDAGQYVQVVYVDGNITYVPVNANSPSTSGNSNGTGYVPQNVTVTATNTRTLDGTIYYTANSELTINIPAQTVVLPGGITATSATITLMDGSWAQGVTAPLIATISGNRITYAAQTIKTGMIPSVTNAALLGRDFAFGVNVRLADTIDGDTTLALYSLATKLSTTAYVLTPTVDTTSLDADSTALSGTAYRASDTIYLKSATTNSILATATPTATGYWTFDLASLGLTTANKLYVLEDGTHAYGDGAGVATVPQYRTASRTITYVDGITGKPISVDADYPVKTQSRTNTIARTDGAPLSALTATSATNYTVTDGTYAYINGDAADFAGISATDLKTFDGYLAATTGVDAIAAIPGSNVNQTVNLYPITLTVDPTVPDDTTTPGTVTPKNEGDLVNPSDPNSPSFPAGVTVNDLNKVVTETVHYIDNNGNTVNADTIQTVGYTRTATVAYSKATDGKLAATITYSNWNVAPNDDGKFEAVSRMIPNYTAINAVPEIVLDNTSDANIADFAKTIYYVADADLKHDVTVTTAYNVPAGATAIPTETATYTFYRTYSLNEATGQVTPNAWTINTSGVSSTGTADQSVTLGEIAADKNIAGYSLSTTSSIDGGAATQGATATITGNNTTVQRTVTYADALLHVVLKDVDDDVVLGAADVDPLDLNLPVYLNGDGTFNFKLDDLASFNAVYGLNATLNAYPYVFAQNEIYLNEDGEDGQLNGIDKASQFETGNAVAGQTLILEFVHNHVQAPATTRRTIQYQYTDGSEASSPVNQTANWTKDTDVALYVAGDPLAVTYTQDTGYASLISPTIVQFKADMPTVAATTPSTMTVSALPAPTSIAVTYNRYIYDENNPGSYNLAADSIRVINYRTTDSQIVKSPLTQTVHFTRTYNTELSTYSDWMTANGDFDATTADVSATVNGKTYFAPVPTVAQEPAAIPSGDDEPVGILKIVTVRYYPASILVPPTAPKDEGTPTVTSDNGSPKYPAGVSSTNLRKTITETINYVNATSPANVPAARQDTVSYTRSATVNYTPNADGTYTSSVVYGSWQAVNDDDTFDAVTPPSIAGFLPDQRIVAAVTMPADKVTADNQDFTTTVTYYPATLTVTPDQPKTVDTPTVTGDPNSPKYPAGVDAADLNKTITETVHFVDGDDNATVAPDNTDAQINYTRIATVTYRYGTDGKLTGTVTYSAWTPTSNGGTFAAVAQPIISGYTAPAGQVGAITKTGNDSNFEVTIKYFKNANLTGNVSVTTHYDAYTDGNNLVHDAHSDAPQTVTFYRQPTFDNTTGTYGYTAWTTQTSGISADSSDLTATVAAINTTVPEGFHLVVKTDTDGAVTQTVVNPETVSTDLANTSVVVNATDKVITRTVSYIQDYYTIKFVDINDPANPVALGTIQKVGDPYQANSTDVPSWGLLEIATDSQYLADENGTVVDGIETFAAQPGKDYTIELKHVIDQSPVTVRRVITYVFEDGTMAAAPVTQTEAWTRHTDLYLTANNGTVTVNANGIVYTQNNAFDAVTSPVTGTSVTGNFDLSEYVPDRAVVAAGTTTSGYVTTAPIDAATVIVTYKRNIFTPTNPGAYADQLRQVSTRTINYVDGITGNEIETPVVQTVTFTRRYNATTQTYTAWTATAGSVADHSTNGEFNAQDLPTIAGFITTATVTPAKVATIPSSEVPTNETVTVTYYPTAVTIPPTGQPGGGSTVPGIDTAPKYPSGVDRTDLNEAVTETVHYLDGKDKISPVSGDQTQSVSFIRTATVNYTVINGEYVADAPVYSSWTAVNGDTTLDEVVSPAIDGLVTTTVSVSAVTGVAATDDDITVNVYYYPASILVTTPTPEGTASVTGDPDSPKLPGGLTANELTQQVIRTISYRDNEGNALADDKIETINYVRTATVDYSQLDADGKPTITYNGWTVAPDSPAQAFNAEIADSVLTKDGVKYVTLDPAIPAVTVTANSPDQATVVIYYPAVLTVTPDNGKTPGINTVPGDNNSPKYPAGVAERDLNLTLTQTVNYLDGRNKTTVLKQPTTSTVVYTRSATLDYSQQDDNGDAPLLTYTDWQAVDGDITFEGFVPVVINGFITNATAVASQTTTPTDATGSHDVTLYYYPATIEVPVGGGETPGGDTVTGDGDSPKYPAGVDTTDLTQVIMQLVHFVSGVDGTTTLATDETHTVTFTRGATIDYTQQNAQGQPGKVTYTDWTETPSDGFAAFTPKQIDGFVTYTQLVPAQSVSADDAANSHDVTVYYYPSTVTVTPEDPKKPTDKTPGNEGSPLYPAGVDISDLNKTVTETIHFVDGTNTTKKVHDDYTATIQFSRTATVDYATLTDDRPTVIYGKWVVNTTGVGSDTATQDASANFSAVISNPAEGYLTPANTPSQSITADSHDLDITVTYYPTIVHVPSTGGQPEGESTVPTDDKSPKYPDGVAASDLNQQAVETIRYVDAKTGTQLVAPTVQKLDFKRDATITYAQDGTATVTYSDWQAVNGNTFAAVTSPTAETDVTLTGYVVGLAKTDAVTVSGPVPVALTVYYYTSYTVGPSAPKDAGEVINREDPNSPVYPPGVSKADLNQTVTETIYYVDKVTGKTVAPSVTQQLQFERTAYVTYTVKGETNVTYTAWTAVGENGNTFPARISPVIEGMTPDQAVVAAITQTDPSSVVITVSYTANPVPPTEGGQTTTETPEGSETPEITETPKGQEPEVPAEKPKTPTVTPEVPESQPKKTLQTPVEAPVSTVGTKETAGKLVGERIPMQIKPVVAGNTATNPATKKLPQTNESHTSDVSLLGLLGLWLLGLLGLNKKRKYDEK